MSPVSEPTHAPRGRVAHVVRRYGVASQTFVADAVADLDRIGWSGWVLARSVENGSLYPLPREERILLGSRPPLGQRVAQRALMRSGAERRAAWWNEAIAAARPDLLHAHFGWAGVDALPAARSAGLPLVVTFHGTDLTVHPHTARGRREYAAMLAGLDQAIVVSRFLAGRLRAIGYHGPLEVVPTGVRLDRPQVRREPRADGSTRLLFVGRQVRVKGLDVLLRALPRLCADEPRLVLEVIGDGPERARNDALARKLGVRRHVSFRGAQPREQVLAALERADLLVVPSRTTADGAAEGAGLVPKEAMAAGLPVLATRSGGLPETMPPDYRHELVPEGDHEALAARIAYVLQRPESWPLRAHAGRRWVESQFDHERVARRTAAIYAELLDRAAERREPAPAFAAADA
jgi:colanic acid/amylovoran biosynthesis glycosyltransferase